MNVAEDAAGPSVPLTPLASADRPEKRLPVTPLKNPPADTAGALVRAADVGESLPRDALGRIACSLITIGVCSQTSARA